MEITYTVALGNNIGISGDNVVAIISITSNWMPLPAFSLAVSNTVLLRTPGTDKVMFGVNGLVRCWTSDFVVFKVRSKSILIPLN
jgi:hypothetical protein